MNSIQIVHPKVNIIDVIFNLGYKITGPDKEQLDPNRIQFKIVNENRNVVDQKVLNQNKNGILGNSSAFNKDVKPSTLNPFNNQDTKPTISNTFNKPNTYNDFDNKSTVTSTRQDTKSTNNTTYSNTNSTNRTDTFNDNFDSNNFSSNNYNSSSNNYNSNNSNNYNSNRIRNDSSSTSSNNFNNNKSRTDTYPSYNDNYNSNSYNTNNNFNNRPRTDSSSSINNNKFGSDTSSFKNADNLTKNRPLNDRSNFNTPIDPPVRLPNPPTLNSSEENNDLFDDDFNDGLDDLLNNASIDFTNQNFQTSSTVKTATRPNDRHTSRPQPTSTITSASHVDAQTANTYSSVTNRTIESVTLDSANVTIDNSRSRQGYTSIECELVEDDSASLPPLKNQKYNFDSSNEDHKVKSDIFDSKKKFENDDCCLLSSDDEIEVIEMDKDIKPKIKTDTFPDSKLQQSTPKLKISIDQEADEIVMIKNEVKPFANSRLAVNNIDRELNAKAVEGLSQLDDFFEDVDEKPASSNPNDVSFNISKLNQSTGLHLQFTGNYKNDGQQEKFKRKNYDFSNDLVREFDNTFGLKQFRTNQLETMNAILLNHDCFVLMPTGGGKSVCYQLPAVVSPGITIVISPLKSLIQDQIQKLHLRNVGADTLTTEISIRKEREIYDDLNSEYPTIKLLYLTPEKLSSNERLKRLISSLYERNLLARLVIDEAHCVSQWGHDFRPDYKKLADLRNLYPGLPIMALTATATERVRIDILNQLKMKDPVWFIQSFNRPNLKFEVRHKDSKSLDEIGEKIKQSYFNKCGIIYCFSRNECEEVAKFMCQKGIRAKAYHAGLTDKIRAQTQEQWLNGRFYLICATIAFGMGIDKPDVRYVFHYTLPKSIEGYYQESGRAGRDNQTSECYLYYCPKDIKRISYLITDGDNKKSQESVKVELDNLNHVIYYCSNDIECRRVQLLRYFGETFDAKDCKNSRTVCDNCLKGAKTKTMDYTDKARCILESIYKVLKSSQKDFTLNHYIDVLKGSKNHKVTSSRHDELPCHGLVKGQEKGLAERILRKMINDGFLKEEFKKLQHDNVVGYLTIGNRAKEVYERRTKFEFPVVITPTNTQQRLPVNEKNSNNNTAEYSQIIFDALERVSRDIAEKLRVHHYNIINLDVLHEIAEKMPTTREEFLKIPGVSVKLFNDHGEKYIQEIKACKAMLDEARLLNESNIQLDDFDDDFGEQEDMDFDQDFHADQPSTSNYKSRAYGNKTWGKRKKATGTAAKSKYFKKPKTGLDNQIKITNYLMKKD